MLGSTCQRWRQCTKELKDGDRFYIVATHTIYAFEFQHGYRVESDECSAGPELPRLLCLGDHSRCFVFSCSGDVIVGRNPNASRIKTSCRIRITGKRKVQCRIRISRKIIGPIIFRSYNITDVCFITESLLHCASCLFNGVLVALLLFPFYVGVFYKSCLFNGAQFLFTLEFL